MNPFRYRTAEGNTRTQALQVLKQTGELKKLIDRVESQIARSPDSIRLYEQLVEYYTANGDRNKAAEYLQKAVDQKPDAIIMRYQLAKHLESTNKPKEACDQHLAILKLNPSWFFDDYYSIQNVFKRARRSMELAQSLEKMNLKRIRQPYYIVELVGALMEEEKDPSLAISLFEKIYEAYPTYRSTMLSRMRNPKIWSNAKMIEIGKKIILAAERDVAERPWYGMDHIYSRSSNGTVSGDFGSILNGLEDPDKRAEFQKSIDEHVVKHPGWLGGKAMSALLDLKANRREKAHATLLTLFDDEAVMKTIPGDACYLIGQELDQFPHGQPIALRLYERAIGMNDSNSSQQLQFSPIIRMIKLYTESGRKDDARNLLHKVLRTNTFPNYDVEYASYQRIENTLWAAKQFQQLGFGVDAAKLFRGLLDNPEGLQSASRWNGQSPDYYVKEANGGMAKALASLDGADAPTGHHPIDGDPRQKDRRGTDSRFDGIASRRG